MASFIAHFLLLIVHSPPCVAKVRTSGIKALSSLQQKKGNIGKNVKSIYSTPNAVHGV
jgi:hypothetical protein